MKQGTKIVLFDTTLRDGAQTRGVNLRGRQNFHCEGTGLIWDLIT